MIIIIMHIIIKPIFRLPSSFGIGAPHFGHFVPLVDTICPQFTHLISAIIYLVILNLCGNFIFIIFCLYMTNGRINIIGRNSIKTFIFRASIKQPRNSNAQERVSPQKGQEMPKRYFNGQAK